jgi:hypothetical protein
VTGWWSGGLGGILFGDARDQVFGWTRSGRGAKPDFSFSLGHGYEAIFVGGRHG